MGGVTFDNIREKPNEPIRIDIAGLSSQIIDDFLASDSVVTIPILVQSKSRNSFSLLL
jgi:hypothetical protein